MEETASDFPQFVFSFNRPLNYRDVTGYKEHLVDPEADPQDEMPLKKDKGHFKAPTGDQSKHTDLGVHQATNSPMCAIILAPISSSSKLHVTPMGHDVMAALKNHTSIQGSMADYDDFDFLDKDLSREVHLSAPPNTNLSNGIPLESVMLQLSQGQSCALLPCTPHAGAGISKRNTDRNFRLHIVLYHCLPPLLTSLNQTSGAYISTPLFHQFCG